MAIITLDESRKEKEQEKKEASKSKPQRIYEGLKEEEFLSLIKATPDLEHQTAFILAAGAGLRLSEVVNLKPEDVDFKGNKIFIRQAKGARDRLVNIPQWLKEKHYNLLPLKIKPRTIESAFLRISQKIGINQQIGEYETKKGKKIPLWKYRFHSLRHFFTVRCIQKGMLLPQVQVLLGHRNISTTSRYANVSQQDAINAAIERGI